MVISNTAHFFGSTHHGVVNNGRFACAVSTAPEGLFKSFSSIFKAFDPKADWSDAWQRNEFMIMAKAMLHPALTKIGRAEVHKTLLESLALPEAHDLGFAA